jgi:hypothetical protein
VSHPGWESPGPIWAWVIVCVVVLALLYWADRHYTAEGGETDG